MNSCLIPKKPSSWKEFIMTTVMTMHQPILSLIAGILILIFPKLLNFIVAIYLIIAGIVGLLR
jgi:hypothetical protein